MSEKNTQFNYLLNALEFAAQAENPAKADYGGARRRLFEHVRELERKAALWDSINGLWHFPGKTLEEIVATVAAERAAAVSLPPMSGLLGEGEET